MYKPDLALANLHGFICHKRKGNNLLGQLLLYLPIVYVGIKEKDSSFKGHPYNLLQNLYTDHRIGILFYRQLS